MKKTKLTFFWMAAFALMLSTLLTWGVATGWGKVQITRVNIPAYNGKNLSYLIWIPETATNDTPATTVINFHGRSNSAHTMDTWAMEMARRGYIAVNVDWAGGGETDVLPSDIDYIRACIDNVKSLDVVDEKKLVLAGWSAGTVCVSLGSEMYSENTIGAIVVMGPAVMPMGRENIVGAPPATNTLIIKALGDQYNYNFLGAPEACAQIVSDSWNLPHQIKSGEYNGSIEDGTLIGYIETRGIHQTGTIDNTAIMGIVEFLDKVSPAVSPIPSNNMIWGWEQLCAILGYVSFISFILALGSTLFENIPYFSALGNPLPVNRGLRGKKLILNIAISILVPTITFIPISRIGHNLNVILPIFRSRNLNGIIFWLICNSVITLLSLFIQGKTKKKKTFAELGMAGENTNRINVGLIWRALLLAIIVVSISFAWIAFVEKIFGINYQVWMVVIMSEATPERILMAIPYILCAIFVLTLSGIGMNTIRRLADTGNEKRDMLLQILLNVVVAAFAVTFWLLFQYGINWIIGTGYCPLPQMVNRGGAGTSVGSLDFSFGFPLILGFTAVINTFFFRKTGNIWLGTFIGAILAGLTGAITYTIAI